MAERTEAAVKVMLDLAEEFASEGFTAKAVSILKEARASIQRAPGSTRTSPI